METTRCGLMIFDMGGTTVQDDGQVEAALRSALAAQGVRITAAQIAGVRGRSKREAMLQLLPDRPGRLQRADDACVAFRRLLRDEYLRRAARPIAGVEAVFQRLRFAGVRIALTTGFDRETADLLLTSLAWDRGTVDAVVTADDVPMGRPAPYLIFRAMEKTGTTSVHEVANAGDTTLDTCSSHNAGTRWNIAVLSGAHSRAQLETAPHTHLVASVADLPECCFTGIAAL